MPPTLPHSHTPLDPLQKCPNTTSVFGQVYQKDQDSKMLCEACFLSAAPPCAVCGKPVVGTVAKVGENSYHPECLLCSSCGVQLTGSFTKTDTGFRCSECQTA